MQYFIHNKIEEDVNRDAFEDGFDFTIKTTLSDCTYVNKEFILKCILDYKLSKL